MVTVTSVANHFEELVDLYECKSIYHSQAEKNNNSVLSGNSWAGPDGKTLLRLFGEPQPGSKPGSPKKFFGICTRGVVLIGLNGHHLWIQYCSIINLCACCSAPSWKKNEICV